MNEPMAQSNTSSAGPPAGSAPPGTQAPTQETRGGEEVHHIAALCERVRKTAQQWGEEALRAKQQQAETLLRQAREQAEAGCQAEAARLRERLHKQVGRELQSARLKARLSIANFRWSQLDGVLSEAEREIGRIRQNNPQRYIAALCRFFQAASQQLGAAHLVVRGNSQDIQILRDRLRMPETQFIEDDIAAGIVVTTSNGGVAFDQSIARRRERLEHPLRLAAAEILFPEEARSPSAIRVEVPG